MKISILRLLFCVFCQACASMWTTSAWAQETLTPTPKPAPTRVPATNTVLAGAGFKIKDNKAGGSGAYGANRRVFAEGTGYRGVEGTFLMPSAIYLGKEYVADGTEKGDDGKPTALGKNPRQNKPTFYFGADGHNFNFEVGFQYEALYKDRLDAGWSAYSSVTLTYAPSASSRETVGNWYQSVASSNRQPQSARASVPAKVIINADGSISSELGIFPRPRNDFYGGAEPNIYPSITRPDGQVPKTSISLRRVAGMTQMTGLTGDDEGDGAFVHNVGFTKGYLYRWAEGQDALPCEAWSTGDHNYEPTYYNIGHETDGPDGGPIFVVNSVSPWNRLPNGDKRPDASVYPGIAPHSRYFEESVNIDLLTMPGKIEALPKKTAKSLR